MGLVANLFCFLLLKTTVAYHQNDYTIKHHRAELISHDENYLREVTISLEHVNRTARGISTSFNLVQDFAKLVYDLQVYKFASNEYRQFPLALQFDLCEEFHKDTYGLHDVFKYSNITLCPLKKNHYFVNKYRPDESKFPPYLPGGDYKMSLQIIDGSNIVVEVHWYGSIKPIEKLRWA